MCLCLGVLAVLLTGCANGPRLADPLRAIWVTRYDYKSADDVKQIVADCADAGFNAILFQVCGNGTSFYKSNFEPWAEEFNFEDPGFDPLALAIDLAHERDVALHAWVNVMPAWRGPDPPAHPDQLYNKHPDWFWYDKDGNRQPLNHKVGEHERGWYASLNPCLPEVRDYLVGVFRDIASNYDIDGLHMDYVRFPNERVVPGETIPDYPRDARTLALYKADTGLTPGENADVWNQWRARQVTRLVTAIHAMLRESNPHAILSAAVTSVPNRGAQSYFQDARTWVSDGVLDAAIIMNYSGNVNVFRERLKEWTPFQGEARIVPGLSIGRLSGDTGAEAAEKVKQEIDIARATTGSFCVFAYASLFPTADAALDSIPAADQAKPGATTGLLDYLQELAATDD